MSNISSEANKRKALAAIDWPAMKGVFVIQCTVLCTRCTTTFLRWLIDHLFCIVDFLYVTTH